MQNESLNEDVKSNRKQDLDTKNLSHVSTSTDNETENLFRKLSLKLRKKICENFYIEMTFCYFLFS